MSIAQDSTTSTRPAKPYPDFPLYAHKIGRWAKKICGRTHFLGRGGIGKRPYAYTWQRGKTWRPARRPRRQPGVSDALTVQEMVARFLRAPALDVESRALDGRTWKEYESFGERMIRVFGGRASVQDLGLDDFLKLKATSRRPTRACRRSKGTSERSRSFSTGQVPAKRDRICTTVRFALGRTSRPLARRPLNGSLTASRRGFFNGNRFAVYWPRPVQSCGP